MMSIEFTFSWQPYWILADATEIDNQIKTYATSLKIIL